MKSKTSDLLADTLINFLKQGGIKPSIRTNTNTLKYYIKQNKKEIIFIIIDMSDKGISLYIDFQEGFLLGIPVLFDLLWNKLVKKYDFERCKKETGETTNRILKFFSASTPLIPQDAETISKILLSLIKDYKEWRKKVWNFQKQLDDVNKKLAKTFIKNL